MELIEFYDLPEEVQTRFKKESDSLVKKLFKKMGIPIEESNKKDQFKWMIKDCFFYKESGMFFYFKPKKI